MGKQLSTAQSDRAAGVLLGLAAGDALGVPYEFARPPGVDAVPEMRGGGLGNFAPGEWSDDTSMAMAIAEVAATGVRLDSEAALDAIAKGFLAWHASGPADIGIQTSAVLGATSRLLAPGESVAAVMALEAASYSAGHPHSAGNGALMRTAPVALAHLDDRSGCASAARAIARLTHADPLAGDSCVLWSEAIRVAVVERRLDIASGLDLIPESRREEWAGWLRDALTPDSGPVPGARFTPNGFTVTALQAAVAAIWSTPSSDLHLERALANAVRIGNDTDTVAAIAGSLLGAFWGASAVPSSWRSAVHGWPGRDGEDLVALATRTACSGLSTGGD